MVAITTVLRFTKSQELRRFPVFSALLAVSLMIGRVFANDWPEVLTIAVGGSRSRQSDFERPQSPNS